MHAVDDCGRIVYDDIGVYKKFTEWARQNPTDFYRICDRLISTQRRRSFTRATDTVLLAEIPEAHSAAVDTGRQLTLIIGFVEVSQGLRDQSFRADCPFFVAAYVHGHTGTSWPSIRTS